MLNDIYYSLLEKYGYQGWWPLLELHGSGVNPTKTGSVNGYHPGNYLFPENDMQRFEFICGALLTQNTAWPNVEKALLNLRDAGILSAEGVLGCGVEKLKELIRPAGYFNKKAESLKVLAGFFIVSDGKIPGRDELLALKGVGPETADSILLYAYKVPVFVVDAYTRRILEGLGLIEDGLTYEEIKTFVEGNFEGGYEEYCEFHALLVEHAKRFYLGKNKGEGDFLK